MKKVLSLMLVIATMFASCSQSDELLIGGNDAETVTFTLTADGVEQTRAGEALRYVMAIYDETETNVVLAETEFATSSFAVRLDPGNYTCLFWADYGSENYDAANLKSVAPKDDATNAEAFFAKQSITVAEGGAVSVTLHRAVAKIVLKETDRLEPGSVTMTYDGYKGFDVSAGNAINEATFTRVFTIASAVEASVASPAEVGNVLMLANPAERVLQDFKVKYNDEAEKTITNVPVQANYVTNINGKYSVNVAQQFTIIVDDTWATPENEYDMIPYVTFSAASEQTFTFNFDPLGDGGVLHLAEGEYFEYSVGGGEWTRFTTTVSDVPFGGALGDLRLRGERLLGTTFEEQWTKIAFGDDNVKVYGSGDIRTLVDYKNYRTVSTKQARFHRLFYNCTALVTAPELSSMTLASSCYSSMFNGCTSLTEAPELPATVLAKECYNGMFSDCTSLTAVPELPATELSGFCYSSMFSGCTSLTTAPELPATTLSGSCYAYMFRDCTSLTKAPELPAAELNPCCYQGMFSGCSNLSEVTMLASNI
ncbi:MAG: hypothetical protein ACI31D_03970, partial [Candidatus Limisoma sp.]